MATAQIQRGFTEEVSMLVQTAQTLGELRRSGNREEFNQILEAIGMDSGEADSYFDLVLPVKTRDLSWDSPRVKSNSMLADVFGISLANGEGQPPRNWLLYRLFACQFPGMFEATYSGRVHLPSMQARANVPSGMRVNPEHRVINFSNLPLDSRGDTGNPLAIHRVIQGHEPAKFRGEVLRIANPLRIALGEDLGIMFADLLFALQMLIPPQRTADLLAKVIDAGQRGEMVTLAGAFCPDYAYESTGNPHIPYRYTFKGVGEGIGLVAQQFARIIPELSRFFQKLGIPHQFVIGIGDFEADSESTLRKVELSRTEFIRRCKCSLDAFQELMPADIPLTLELFGEGRGQGRLRPYALEATGSMKGGNFGRMPELHEDLQVVIDRIPKQYRTFYERWHDRSMDDETLRGIVYDQGGEYASVAHIYSQDFGENVIMLAGDRPEMNRFNAFYDLRPVLCAKRAY